ncbi:MAG TPA: FtsX-like permease family protein [Stellaceae bacterium]|nr:FtsX-like permease family protein [Stellaceae bacterium]
MMRLRGAQRRLTAERDEAAAFVPWLVALMVYLAGLGGVGLIVLDDALRAAAPLAATMTLQVPADASKARLETVLAVLRQTPGVVSVHLLDAPETAQLVEPWLGPSVPLDQLPVPHLIDLRIAPDAATDFAALRRQLATVAPGARLDDQRPLLAGMRAATRRLDGVLGAAILVALLLIALLAVFAVRSNLAARRPALELLRLLGADDSDIVRPVATRWLWLGLAGGAIGAGAALLTILALRGAGAVVQLPPPDGGIADWRLLAVLAGAALAAGIIAMASARVTMLRHLAQLP